MEQLVNDGIARVGAVAGPILAVVGATALALQVLLLLVDITIWSLACFAVVSAAGIALLYFGFIFTALSSVGLTVAWALSLLLTMVALVLLRRRPNHAEDHSLVAVSAIVGLLVTAVTAVQVINPAQPVFGVPGACTDAPVTHSLVTVRSGGSGQNARTGPATSYPVARRYDASCLLGVDGYCIGAPIIDSTSQLPDYRWFRARFSRNYLPAALVFEISGVDADLGLEAEKNCPGGRTDPGFRARPKLDVKDAGANVSGDFTATGTTLIGFASATGNGTRSRITQVDGRVHHSQALDFNGDGHTDSDADKVRGEAADPSRITFPTADIRLEDADETGTLNGTIYAAVPCLAANVPSYTGALFYRANGAEAPEPYQPDLQSTFEPTPAPTPNDTPIEARLAAAACALGR